MVLPSSIDLRHPENYLLTLRISTRAIFFMIAPNDSMKKCLTCKKFLLDQSIDIYENIKKLFFELSFLSMPFHHVVIEWVNTSYTIEPQAMLDLYNKQDLYSISQTVKDNSTILVNKEVSERSNLLFQLDKSIYGFLTRNLFQPVVLSHITPLIHFMTKKAPSLHHTFMYVNCFEDSFDILLFQQGKFQLAQSYSLDEEDEMFYFTIKLWEDSKMNQLEDILFYNGFSISLIKLLKDYIKQVELFILPSEINLWTKEIDVAPLDMISLLL